MSRKSLFVTVLSLVMGLSGIEAGAANPLPRHGRDTLAEAAAPLPAEDSISAPLPAVDSIAAELPDSLRTELIDTLAAVMPEPYRGTLEVPAFSGAADSIIEDFSNGRKMIYYYGGVTVQYGDISITADHLAYNMADNTVFAIGRTDTLTGEITGKPEMKEGNQTYTMETVLYNFDTRKAKIRNMVTRDNQGIIHGGNIKKMPDNSLNITDGKYTVCDADHPHYYLKMTAAKTMPGSDSKTVFGPTYLVVEDVPLPVGLPFGFVPKVPERASGILMPSFGEEQSRGLYMRDAGMYFVFGNHFDIALTGSIYTLGSWNAKLNSRYKVRYKFDGNIGITYSVDKSGEKDSPDYFETRNFGVSWSHSQDSKAHPGTTFRASVNFSSPSNNKYNSQSVTQATQNQTTSTISYGKTFSFGSLSINAQHSQNSRDSSYSVTFPNVTFSVNRFFPLKRRNAVGKERFYEKISLSYNTTLQNKIAFKASEVKDMDILGRLQNGMTHAFQIGLPQFTLAKYIQASPTISYGMNWYFHETKKYYNEETQKVETETGKQFSSFGISQNYSGGISFSTRIYGLFNFGKDKKLQAVRHMITPSLSVNYKPELGTRANGYETFTYIDSKGVERTEEYNRYSGNLYNPPGKGKTGGLSFQIGNNLEAKVRNDKDTTGKEATKKVKLLDQLNINGSYNFLADSLKLSKININASTTVFGKLAISGNMTLDPYAINSTGRTINTFNVIKTGKLARLTSAGASMSYSINGKGAGKGNDGSKVENTPEGDYTRVFYHPVTGEYIPGGWVYYLNPNIPWSLSFNLNYTFQRSYQYANEQLQVKDSHLKTLSVSGQVRLTPKMNISMNTGVDLSLLKLTSTQINATYDLHCFNISVSWVPTGQWAQWSFRIAANASALSDLLQFKKASSYWDH